MGVPLYADDLLEACAPWGNVCVVAGTHYIPIALPSIIASLFLFAPLVAVFLKLQSAEAKLVLAEEKIEALESRLRDESACCLLYTSPSPRDKRQSRMPSSA